ncbi:MAG TPA: hypothetical protein VK843_01655 [Planctomycetota bacterium]|nr:hypothetical protein [Planctomycetota bacterium]
MKPFQLLCFALASTALAHADVRVVRGPGSQFNEIQDAVNAAVDGDLLLIRAGSYAPVLIDGKALSLCADGAVNVTITGGLTIQNTSAIQVNVVSGIRVNGVQSAALQLFSDLGPVRIQDCVFTGADGAFAPQWSADGWPGAWVEGSTGVSFAKCTLQGGGGASCIPQIVYMGNGGDGVYARGSRIAFTSCVLHGSGGGGCQEVGDSNGGQGGCGLLADGGVYSAAGSTLLGGSGGSGADPGGFHSGGCGGVGGDGARLLNANTVGYWIDNSMSGAPGGTSFNPSCPFQSPAGVPINVQSGAISTPLSGLARKFHVQQPIREQSAATLEFRGQPGDKVYLVEGNDTRLFFLSLASHGISLVRTPVLSSSIPLGVIPPNGLLQIQRPQGDLVPGLQHRQRFAQGILVDAAGQSFLTDVQAMELLDSAY